MSEPQRFNQTQQALRRIRSQKPAPVFQDLQKQMEVVLTDGEPLLGDEQT